MDGRSKTNDLFYCLKATPFGSLAVVWSIYRREPKIIRILLLKPKMSAKQNMARYFPNSMTSSCQKINTLVNQIMEFLDGKDIHFPLDMVRLDLCSVFQQKVLRAVHAIPHGMASTYLLIAKHIGNPNGARAVGIALATNPFPIIIPCHRAIRSDGLLGGYQGGLKMKRALLKIEGVSFCGIDRVTTADFFYGEKRCLKSPSVIEYIACLPSGPV